MNPLVQLKERLVHITIAGTELIEEDFRLKNTFESFSVLADKNPVFKKIYLSLKQLFEAEKSQKPIILLNILGLLDAVLYTQAQTAIDGEYKELETNQNLESIYQFRYSEVKPVLDALTTTGSGRVNVIEDAIKLTPYIFKNYRILNALINDLDDTYGEMATRIFDIVESLGTDKPIHLMEYDYTPHHRPSYNKYYLPEIDKDYIISLLKNNFDPQGKKIMAKRLKLISIIAKETENDWYLSILETAKKEVREEAISALQYSDKNTPLLLELAKKERGKAKDMVYSVLGKFKFDNMAEFWGKELEKSPEYALNLKESDSDEISDLLADYIKENLKKVLNYDEKAQKYNYPMLLSCTVNKTSDKMLKFYKWILSSETNCRFKNLKDEWTHHAECLESLDSTIFQTLILSCPANIVDFLNNLPDNHKRNLARSCFVADLLTLSASEVYKNWYKNPILTIPKLKQTLEDIRYIDNSYYITTTSNNGYPYNSYPYESNLLKRKLKEPLDERWFDYMISLNLDDLLRQLAPKEPYELCQKIGEYFYNRILDLKIDKSKVSYQYTASSQVLDYLYMIHYCSYNKYEGLILNICKKYQQIYPYNLIAIFRKFRDYAGAEATYNEAKSILEFYKKNYDGKSTFLDVEQVLINEGFVKEEI